MARTGTLDRVFYIDQPVAEVTKGGTKVVSNWTRAGHIFAGIMDSESTEQVSAQRRTNETTLKLRTRYDTRVATGVYLTDQNMQRWRVTGVVEVERRRMMDVTCFAYESNVPQA